MLPFFTKEDEMERIWIEDEKNANYETEEIRILVFLASMANLGYSNIGSLSCTPLVMPLPTDLR